MTSGKWKWLGLVAVAFVAGGILGWRVLGGVSAGNTTLRASNSLPVEYLYLDSARVNAYLGELQGGLPTSEKQSLSNTSSTSLGLSAGGYLTLNNGVSSTQSVEGTVTPDEGDRFYQLLNKVRTFKSEFKAIDLSNDLQPSATLENAFDGRFVELTHARLEIPRFAYDTVDNTYFDTNSAVAMERALNSVSPEVARTLQLPSSHVGIIHLVQEAEALSAPGTVVVPIAIYT